MRIVILGAGVGGQVAANELRRSLPVEHRVTLIERDARHAFAPSFLWVMTGDRRPAQVTRDVRELVRPGVEVPASPDCHIRVNCSPRDGR
jgi:sulfide:quinone oxidoreductase